MADSSEFPVSTWATKLPEYDAANAKSKQFVTAGCRIINLVAAREQHPWRIQVTTSRGG